MGYEGKSRNEIDAESIIVGDFIEKKTLKTIMKRFLGSKVDDDPVTKVYKVEDGLHFSATSIGAAVDLSFKNNFAGTYNPIKKHSVKYIDIKDVETDAIYEYVEIKKGKSKVRKKTGHTIPYPDIDGVFNKYNLNEFVKLTVHIDDQKEYLNINESMVTLSKLGNRYFTSVMRLYNGKLQFTVYDCRAKFIAETSKFVSDNLRNTNAFFYNPEYFVAILKTLKDLKVESFDIYIDDTNPIFIISHTTEYDFKFAFNRKLVGKASG